MESFESYLHRLNKQHLRARPSRWLEIQNVDGDILYLDKYTNDVTLTDPRNPLPDGWEEGIDGGKRYFIDHNTNLKTYNDPREKNVPQRALNDLLDDIIDDIYKKQSKTLVEEIIDEAARLSNPPLYVKIAQQRWSPRRKSVSPKAISPIRFSKSPVEEVYSPRSLLTEGLSHPTPMAPGPAVLDIGPKPKLNLQNKNIMNLLNE